MASSTDGLNERSGLKDAFTARFPDEDACRAFLDEVRSTTEGTQPAGASVVEGASGPLRAWFAAAWALITEQDGPTAADFAARWRLDETSADMIVKSLRLVMHHTEQQLRDHAAVGEVFHAGSWRRTRLWRNAGRQSSKARVYITVEVAPHHGMGPAGRVRMQFVPSDKNRPRTTFVRHNVASPAVIYVSGLPAPRQPPPAPDDWRNFRADRETYRTLHEHGGYEIEELPDELCCAHHQPLAVHHVVERLYAWLASKGTIEATDVAYQLVSFVYHWNRRIDGSSMAQRFETLLRTAITIKPCMETELAKPKALLGTTVWYPRPDEEDSPESGARPSEPPLYPSEAAELLKVHPRTLARWAKKGKISVIRTQGGHRRYDRDDAERLRNERG